MKRKVKILCTAAVMGCLMTFPTFAAATKDEYKEEVAPIRAELKELESEMKPLREEKKAAAARYKSIRLSKKETGILSVSKETWKRAKELHHQIVEINKNTEKSAAKDLRAQTKAALKEKDFDTALQNMNLILEQKKERQDSLERKHQIWQEIDHLLDQD